MNIPIHLAIALTLIWTLTKDYNKGVRYAVILLICLPQTLGIKFSNVLPVLTAHRIILVILIAYWIKHIEFNALKKVPCKGLFIIIIASNTISLFLAVYFTVSFKRYLSVCIENFLVYLIFASSINDREQIDEYYRTIFLVICSFGMLAIIERHFGIHIAAYLPSFGADDSWLRTSTIVRITFPHPIFAGVALAIGVVLGISNFTLHQKGKKVFDLLMTLVIGSGLYYTFRRGPWLSAVVGLIILFLLGSKKIKKNVLLLLIFPIVVISLRPGVMDTLNHYYKVTFHPYSLEGGSYYYRWELWRKAYQEVNESPARLAFGYGLEYHRYADLAGEFVLSEKWSEFKSWDNEFACLLLEVGFVGLFLYLLFFTNLFLHFIKGIKNISHMYKDVAVSVLSSYVMILFMMTNVKMWSSQIMFLFYIMISLNVGLLNIYQEREKEYTVTIQ